MHSRVMCSDVLVCMYICIHIYILCTLCQRKTDCLLPYHSKISRSVYSSTAFSQVKTFPVWFATPNELFRQSNLYFSIRATWSPGPRNIVLQYAKHCAAMLQIISPFTALIVVIILNSHFSLVHWWCSVRTGYVFCGTLDIQLILLISLNLCLVVELFIHDLYVGKCMCYTCIYNGTVLPLFFSSSPSSSYSSSSFSSSSSSSSFSSFSSFSSALALLC